jgi:hypothetical protein
MLTARQGIAAAKGVDGALYAMGGGDNPQQPVGANEQAVIAGVLIGSAGRCGVTVHRQQDRLLSFVVCHRSSVAWPP